MQKTATLIFFLLLSAFGSKAQKSKEIIYVGTFFGTGSQGIYVYQFDRQNGSLSLVQTVPTAESPSFLTVHPSGKYLYSVNRGPVEEMKNAGSVSAFSIDPKSGKLTLLNSRPSYGNGPCHISLDKTGKWAFVSNYSEGNFVVLPIFDDGLLGSGTDSRKHIGKSLHPERQTKSHVHAAMIAPDNGHVIVADLGTDKLYSYRFNPANGRIAEGEKPFEQVKPGSGPRHFAFHPNGKLVYLAEELTSCVAVFDYDAAKGALTMVQDSIPSLPSTFSEKNTSADIHVHPGGRFLYLSNRGHNALAIFRLDANGIPSLIGHESTRGKTPRNFMIDPKGEFLLAANQDSNDVFVYRIDANTGKLKFTGNKTQVPSPVCLKHLTLK